MVAGPPPGSRRASEPSGRRRGARSRSALVQGRRRLRDARQGVLRRERRRDRRPRGAGPEAGLPRGARHHLPLAPALLPLAAPRRRLRRRRLPGDPSRVRHAPAVPAAARGGAPARDRGPGGAGDQPHLRPAPLVPAGPAGSPRLPGARLLRLERRRPPLRRGADHLHRHGAVELDLGRGGRGLLLAPVLLPPARPQLRQPAGDGGGAGPAPLLGRDGRRRLPPRRHPVPGRARGDELREPARDPPGDPPDPGGAGAGVPRATPAGRGEPVAEGRPRLLRGRGRVPHGLPLPAHAPHLHGPPAGGRGADRGHPPADAAHPRLVPVGALPPQPRRAHPRDGDRGRARLHGARLRSRSPGAPQRRDPAAARPPARQRPPTDRAPQQPALLHAGHAGRVLRRRDRDGGRRDPPRPRRGPDADAVERRPQRRLLHRPPPPRSTPLPSAIRSTVTRR